jgi:uncharacterized protein YyaL (SSP411 family)
MSEFHFSPRPNRAAEIRWRTWGDSPFAEAAAQSKPVLLAISAVWCHWCHVMDETTYSDEGVIDTINSRYIPIRVDNDRRPDVNARYNQGGWPTTAILTPDGALLKGATYVPPDAMRHLLGQIDAFYADPDNRLEVAARIREARERRRPAGDPRPGTVEPDVPARVFSSIDAEFDEVFGGFGSDQKFPRIDLLHFLLDMHARRPTDRTEEIVRRTLHAMAEGGMYDRVHGGFYRYSTTRDFSVPHFEKMLEDLGGLLLACARAGAIFGDAELARVAVDVRSYLDAHLWNPAFGAYGGSQDADETYYALDADGRAGLPEPYVDPTIYASWNAQAAHALIVAGPLLAASGAAADADEWTRKGARILESLWDRMSVDGVMCRWYDGTPHMRGLLGDQVWAARAACAAYDGTGDDRWRSRAVDLVERAESLFEAPAAAYADRPPGIAEPGRLADRNFPFDDNALMARVLLRLADSGGNPAWSGRARTMIEMGARSFRSYGSFAAAYGSAALDLLEPPLSVVIVGPASAPPVVALRNAARSVASPPLHIDAIDVERDRIRLIALGQTGQDAGSALICDERTCFARVRTPVELVGALSHARSSAQTLISDLSEGSR